MAVINGSTVYLNISADGGKTFGLVGFAQDASFNNGAGVRDVSTKFSAGQRDLAEAKREWSLSTGGLVVYAADDLTPVNLFDYLSGRQMVYVEMSGNNGELDFYQIGQATLTAAPIQGGVEDNQTYSATFEGHRYSGANWGDYTKDRGERLGATIEAVPCINQQVQLLRSIFNN